MATNMKNRSLRSSASTLAPAGRSKDTHNRKDYVHNTAPSVFNSSQNKSSNMLDRFNRVMAWSNKRKVPLINCMIVVIFMVATLLASLLLRTQMAQLSFEQTATQSNISHLRQDMEARQAKLDTLEAELPAKAQRMGMIPQKDSISIDLSDYAKKRKHSQPNQEQSKQNKEQNKEQQKQQQKQEKH